MTEEHEIFDVPTVRPLLQFRTPVGEVGDENYKYTGDEELPSSTFTSEYM